MKALTLWRPWPWAIFHAPHNAKRIENRPWKPWASIIGQPIVLHAGKRYDKDGEAMIMDVLNAPGGLPITAEDEGLIGVVTVRGFISNPWELRDSEQSSWFMGPFAWVLDDVRPFAEPIPCKGMQGLWDIPPDIEALVLKTQRNP